MRLIDANKVVKAILAARDKIPRTVPAASYELVSEKPFNHGNSMCGGIRKALRCIEQAPTVDAVPVVRCKNCKYGYPCGDGVGCYHPEYELADGVWEYDKDFFCAFGEQKEGTDNG